MAASHLAAQDYLARLQAQASGLSFPGMGAESLIPGYSSLMSVPHTQHCKFYLVLLSSNSSSLSIANHIWILNSFSIWKQDRQELEELGGIIESLSPIISVSVSNSFFSKFKFPQK